MGRRAETVKRVRSQLHTKTKFSVKMTQTAISSLMCEEVLDSSLLNKTPEPTNRDAIAATTTDYFQWENPLTVKAIQDHSQIKDVRILQNLLRNEDRFLPEIPDYMSNKQLNSITPDMRKIVADWMLEVIQELDHLYRLQHLCGRIKGMGTFCTLPNAMGALCHHSFGLFGSCHSKIGFRKPCRHRRTEETYRNHFGIGSY